VPWHVGAEGSHGCSGYPVIKDSDDTVVTCHETKAEADAHVAALYANVPDAHRVGEPMQSFLRLFPLEDIRILSRAQGAEYADGRTVEAYAAVFDSPTEIHDGQGQYREVIDRSAFNKAIRDAKPQGSRQSWRVGVFYNHAMTIQGTPSERGSMPIGVPLDIRAEERGLLTVSRYAETPLADEVLELIRSGAINSQSFSGRIIRSDPQPGRAGYQRARNGELMTVRRTELGLREYGPTPFAAYPDAAVLSVRSVQASWPASVSATLEEEPAEIDTPSDDGAVPEEPPADGEHSGRESDAQRAALLQRIAVARTTRPGLARQEGTSS
jgi:HK97 family phage prohead protease